METGRASISAKARGGGVKRQPATTPKIASAMTSSAPTEWRSACRAAD
jgi:hypothetical protein